MVEQETAGLDDIHWDWISPRWEWSTWSIRDNISHVASHLFRWYLLRWGAQLFPSGIPYFDEVHFLAGLPSRRLDPQKWSSTKEIMEKLEESLALVRDILARETSVSILEKYIKLSSPGFYGRIASRYPGTLYQDPVDSSIWRLTLEGNLHHSEGEMVTHLFNVQRLKKAQGLSALVDLPQIGYWTLPDWDRSEP